MKDHTLISYEKFDNKFEVCPLCSSSEIYLFHKSSEGTFIYKCKKCKIQFLNPQYTDEYLSDFYSKYTIDQPANDYKLISSHLDILTEIERHTYGGKLFDIGSGHGHLISLARKRGWDVSGYDVDCDTVAFISDKIGINVFCGSFDKLEIQKESIDVITMLHVLEHLKNPISYLEKINYILKNEGVLMIVLPNIQSRSSLMKLFLEKLNIKRKNIASYYDTAHHLFYYTPTTIRNFLENNGFDVKIIYSGKKPYFKNPSPPVVYLREAVLSKIFWTSNMAVLSIKRSSNED